MTHFDLVSVSTADPYHLLDLPREVSVVLRMVAHCQIVARQEKWGSPELYAFSDRPVDMIPHPTKLRHYTATI